MIPLPTVARLIVGLPASLLGRGMNPALRPRGHNPLGSPDDRLPAASRGAYSPIVKYLILEGNKTWFKVSLSSFKRLGSFASPCAPFAFSLTPMRRKNYNSGVVSGMVSELKGKRSHASLKKNLLYLGVGIRIFVFLFQDPFNNDLHFQVIKWIHMHHSIPLATQYSQAYHPPLYYLLAQLFYFGNSSFLYLKLLQLFSLLTSLATFFVLYQMVHHFIHSERIRLYAILFAALLPQFIMFGNYVSNDSLANFIGALLFMQAYLYIEKPIFSKKVWLAVLLGLGLLTKGTFLAFIPVVLLLVFIVEWRAQKRLRTVLLSLLTVAAISVAIGSYKYAESYRHFGDPFIHNTDPLIQKATGWSWAKSQKHTSMGLRSFFDWNIGKLMLHPTVGETTRHSYFLMLYGSFWYQYIYESNLMGNKTAFRYLGSAIYLLALVPTLVLLMGVYALGKKLWAVVSNRKVVASFVQELFSVLVFFATVSLVIFIGIRTDVWSCFQSRLAFPAFWGVIVLFSSGLEIIEKRRKMASAVYWLLNVLFVFFVLYFVVELLIILGLSV